MREDKDDYDNSQYRKSAAEPLHFNYSSGRYLVYCGNSGRVKIKLLFTPWHEGTGLNNPARKQIKCPDKDGNSENENEN